MLATVCEPNLRNAFTEFFEAMREEDVDLQAKGYDNFDGEAPLISIEIIDFQQIYGSVFISREECRLNGIYDISNRFIPPQT